MKQKQPKLAYPHNHFELAAWHKNMLVCGIDEAGRGALAGPVVVAAAIIPPHTNNELLIDSKQMSLQQRNKAFSWIEKHCWYTTIIGSPQLIDTLNIYQATKLCMHQAFVQLIEQYTLLDKVAYIVADAMPLSLPTLYQAAQVQTAFFNYGESISSSIAAASIVAKVTRDALMQEYGKHFPAFNFAQHKGYGTAAHTQEINTHNISIIHRTTFTKSFQIQPQPFKQEALFT